MTLSREPFIYYVSTCRGGGLETLEMAIFVYFQYQKYAYVGEREVQQALKCAYYVIYAWSLGRQLIAKSNHNKTFSFCQLGSNDLNESVPGLPTWCYEY